MSTRTLPALLLAIAGCTAGPEVPSPEGGPNPLAALGPTDPGTLTAAPTAAEIAAKADGWDPRDNYPEYYGYTSAPAGAVRLPGEFEPAGQLLLGLGGGTRSASEERLYLTLMAESSRTADVLVVTPWAEDEQYFVDQLEGYEAADLSRVAFATARIDTVWMRDYGPMVVFDDAKTPYYIDGRYYYGRWNDDYLPTILAGRAGAAVARPQLDFEGGNLLSDGAGRCVTTDRLVENNSARGYGEQDVETILRDYYGCRMTSVVRPLRGEGTGHVDMLVHVTAPKRALVGAYDPSEDERNAAILDDVADELRDDGWTVTRIPMPSNDNGYTFRSYTNALAVNDVVFVPVYADDRRYEAEALAVFEGAYPDRTVRGLDADALIAIGGAIHCVTMTVAR